MRRRLIIVLVISLVTAVALWLSPGDRSGTASSPPVALAPTAPVGAPARVEGARLDVGSKPHVDAEPEPLRLEQRKPARLEGVLVDVRGSKPLPGVAVMLQEDSEIDTEQHDTKTDSEGRFRFENILGPTLTLSARADGRFASEVLTFEEGESKVVRLVLRPFLEQVEYEVVSTSGARIEGFDLVVRPVPDEGWTSRPLPPDNWLGLPRGRFHFHVETHDGRTADEIRDHDPSKKEVVRLVARGDGSRLYEDELPPVELKIKVVDGQGKPVPGTTLSCHRAHGFTDEAGRGVCQVRASDKLWPIEVNARNGPATGTTKATGKEAEVVVVLRSSRKLLVRLATAPPSDGAQGFVRTPNDYQRILMTDTTLELADHPPVRSFICLSHQAPTGVSDHRGCRVVEPEDTEAFIQTGPMGTLRFEALEASGAPVTDLVLYLDRVRFELGGGPHELAVEMGTHVVVLNQASSRIRYEAKVTVQPAQLTDLGRVTLR